MVASRPSRRIVLRAIAIVALLARGGDGLRAEEAHRIAFAEPENGALVSMDTTIRFDVRPAASPIERIDVYVGGKLIGTALPPMWAIVWQAPATPRAVSLQAFAYVGNEVVARETIYTRDLGVIHEVQVQAVQIYPIVRDRRGHYVSTLAAADFIVVEGGRTLTIDSFDRQSATLTVALVLDVSESMQGNLPAVQEAAMGFVDRLSGPDQVGVYAFNHGIVLERPPDTDRAAVRSAVASVRPGGGTALFDAVAYVLSALEMLPGRRVLLLFSDGKDERSLLSLDRLIERTSGSEVVIYTVAAMDGAADDHRPDLSRLATGGGGEALVVANARDVGTAFAKVLADVRAQYVLSFSPPPGPNGKRHFEVRVSKKNHTVRNRTTYNYSGSD